MIYLILACAIGCIPIARHTRTSWLRNLAASGAFAGLVVFLAHWGSW